MRAVIKGVCVYVCARVSVIDEVQRALQIYDSASDRTTILPLFQPQTFHSQLPTDSERAKERKRQGGRKGDRSVRSAFKTNRTQRSYSGPALHLPPNAAQTRTLSHSKTLHGQECPVTASLCFHAQMATLSTTLCCESQMSNLQK